MHDGRNSPRTFTMFATPWPELGDRCLVLQVSLPADVGALSDERNVNLVMRRFRTYHSTRSDLERSKFCAGTLNYTLHDDEPPLAGAFTTVFTEGVSVIGRLYEERRRVTRLA